VRVALGERSYEVVVGPGLLSLVGERAAGLDPDNLPLTRAIARAIRADEPLTIPWSAFHH
jgi:hypothetical protein